MSVTSQSRASQIFTSMSVVMFSPLPTWTPDLVPALWRKVEILSEDAVRIWAAGIDYIVGDEVAYPDENGTRYTCQQAHTAQTGWEPPAVPALWQEKVSGSAEESTDENQIEEV